MKDFIKNNWTLVLVLIYFILPDFIPGPVDDVLLLAVERFINKRMESKASDNTKEDQKNEEKSTKK